MLCSASGDYNEVSRLLPLFRSILETIWNETPAERHSVVKIYVCWGDNKTKRCSVDKSFMPRCTLVRKIFSIDFLIANGNRGMTRNCRNVIFRKANTKTSKFNFVEMPTMRFRFSILFVNGPRLNGIRGNFLGKLIAFSFFPEVFRSEPTFVFHVCWANICIEREEAALKCLHWDFFLRDLGVKTKPISLNQTLR